jgi:hypothetical protein
MANTIAVPLAKLQRWKLGASFSSYDQMKELIDLGQREKRDCQVRSSFFRPNEIESAELICWFKNR